MNLENGTGQEKGTGALEQALAVVQAPMPDSVEGQLAVDRASDILALAVIARSAASEHMSENGDDVREADAAVQLARQTLNEIKEISRSGGKGGRNVAQLLSRVQDQVQDVAAKVSANEAGSISTGAKHLAIEAAKEAKAASTASVVAKTTTVIKKALAGPLGSSDKEDEVKAPLPKKKVLHDDDYVGTGTERRLRRAPTTAGRVTTKVLQGATFGLMSEATADEVVASAVTGTTHAASGIQAMRDGDEEASDKAALATGRGVRNVLRDDLGMLSPENAQRVGHAATVTLQTVGRGAVYVRNKSDDVADWRDDKLALTSKLGRELNDLLPAIQLTTFKGVLDTDKDGKAELHEVVAKLQKMGINSMKDIDTNHDGDISAVELGVAVGRYQGQQKVKAKAKAAANH